ncbi:hypothetical protein JUNP479_0790 [Aeromonas jandaei]|nr:hypothetical protein JUNP479_0790 [Aeromonas jandaei]
MQKLAEKRFDGGGSGGGWGTQIDQQDSGFRGHIGFLSICHDAKKGPQGPFYHLPDGPGDCAGSNA